MIICGSGHRPSKLGGYSEEIFQDLVRLASTWLGQNFEEVETVISGMALGWDQALGQAVLDLKEWVNFRLVAAVPFKGQESRWPAESRNRYDYLLHEADEVVYVCQEGYAAWKMQRRNEWMVEHSDLVLALWDGSSGGTANCVRYAESRGMQVVNLWDRWKEVRG